MNTIVIVPKSLFGGLLVGFFLFSLFIPIFQAQASLGAACTAYADSNCKDGNVTYSCKSITDNPKTPGIEGGFCTGPCTTDAECDILLAHFKWGGSKCTGSPEKAGPPVVPAVNGTCLESPRQGSKLPDEPPATTGAGLLALIDTLTNWVFAIFTVLAVIFIILAAFQFVTAGGDAAKVGEARLKLIWAMVGIIVALVSKGLVPVIRAIVGG